VAGIPTAERRFWLLLILFPAGTLITFAVLAPLAQLALGGGCRAWACNDVPLAFSGLTWATPVVRANYFKCGGDAQGVGRGSSGHGEWASTQSTPLLVAVDTAG
jgi:hypothetical protein